MHILILTPTLPYPLHQGGAIRNYGILHGLWQAGHQIRLLSFAHDTQDASSTPLAEYCARIITVPAPARTRQQRIIDLLISAEPDLARRLRSARFLQKLCDTLEEQPFDLVQFEGLEMTRYLPIVRHYQPTARLCYDAHNAEYALQQVIAQVDREHLKRLPAALYSYLQARRIRHFEHRVCQQVDLVVAVSEEDAQALNPFIPGKRAVVVPNGIFAAQYQANQPPPDLGQQAMVFTGKMDYRPNVDAMLWFSSDILPLIHQQMPEASLYIVGQQPHPRLDVLRARPHIYLTGRVETVLPYLQAAAVYVAPLRMGSGTRLKILEAMAAGCAVVATGLAAAGLSGLMREHLCIADSEADMAAAVVRLLQDPHQRQRLGGGAREYVRQHYDWSVLMPRLAAAYKDIGIE